MSHPHNNPKSINKTASITFLSVQHGHLAPLDPLLPPPCVREHYCYIGVQFLPFAVWSYDKRAPEERTDWQDRTWEHDGSKSRIHKNRALSVITSFNLKGKSCPTTLTVQMYSVKSCMVCFVPWDIIWRNIRKTHSLNHWKIILGHQRTRKAKNIGKNGAKLQCSAEMRGAR